MTGRQPQSGSPLPSGSRSAASTPMCIRLPKSGVLAQYIPEPWRSKYFLTRKVGDQIYYDAPDYAHAYAMRADTFPADGEFAGSDPDLAFKQLIMEAGSDIAHPRACRLSRRASPR